MDLQKTGAVIAESRKKQGLTQRQLAEKLHVSDRTISKWERGAGYPDISMLTPLASELDISVLSLLEGEYVQDTPAEMTVRDAISTICDRMRTNARKRAGRIIAGVVLLLIILASGFAILDYMGVFARSVTMEVAVGVYEDSVKVGEDIVSIAGKRNTITANSFVGRFAIGCVERSCREGVTAQIKWDDPAPGYESISYWGYGGTWESGVARQLYIARDMTSFALKLDDGTIVATDETYVPLLMLDTYYPLQH